MFTRRTNICTKDKVFELTRWAALSRHDAEQPGTHLQQLQEGCWDARTWTSPTPSLTYLTPSPAHHLSPVDLHISVYELILWVNFNLYIYGFSSISSLITGYSTVFTGGRWINAPCNLFRWQENRSDKGTWFFTNSCTVCSRAISPSPLPSHRMGFLHTVNSSIADKLLTGLILKA